jgi:hypothetical protein
MGVWGSGHNVARMLFVHRVHANVPHEQTKREQWAKKIDPNHPSPTARISAAVNSTGCRSHTTPQHRIVLHRDRKK